jgi:hypothetical protein
MSLYQDFKKYIDADGLTCLNTDGVKGLTTQNGVLFTMQYLFCLLASDEHHDIKLQEIDRIGKIFNHLEVKPGLTVRFTGSPEFDSMDNACAWLTFSALFDEGKFADRMLMHGQTIVATGTDDTQDKEKNDKFYPYARLFNILTFGKVKNFWNSQNPDKFCFQGWFGRSPAMLGLLRMTSEKPCNPFLWLSVLVGQFAGAWNDVSDCDARTLSYINWQYLKTRSIFWTLAYKLWCNVLLRYYPKGMNDVYNRYYLDKNHPIIKYSKPFDL